MIVQRFRTPGHLRSLSGALHDMHPRPAAHARHHGATAPPAAAAAALFNLLLSACCCHSTHNSPWTPAILRGPARM